LLRILCGENTSHGSVALKGLSNVNLRKDCRAISADFSLVPSVDVRDEHELAERVPVMFGDNLTDVLVWGKENGFLSNQSWDTTLLKQHEQSWLAKVAGSVFGFLLFLVVGYCCCREGCGYCTRRRAEERLTSAVRDGVDDVMNVMRS